MIRRRTRARELALQYLYSLEGTKVEPQPDAGRFLAEHSKDADMIRFARDLIDGVLSRREEIDAEIKGVAERWDFSRLAAIDRNVLRIGAYELIAREDIPPQVTLNEAIELAKRYSTEKSGAFVNGLLDKIRERRGRTPTPRPGASRLPRDPAGDTDEEPFDGGDFPPAPPRT